MEKIIYANGTAEVLVPAGQKIVIATYGNEYAELSFKRGNNLEFIQILDNAQVTLGPWTDVRTVNIEAAQDPVSYDVGTNPGLESNVRANFNGSGVVDSFRVGDQNIPLGGGGGGPKIELNIASRGEVYSSPQATSGGRTRFLGRRVFMIRHAASRIKFLYANRYITLTGESDGDNAIGIVQAAMEVNGVTTTPILFGGVRNSTVAIGALEHLSDWVDVAVVPGDIINHRMIADVGASYVSDGKRNSTDQAMLYDPAVPVSDLDSTGPMATPAGATTGVRPYHPVLIIGEVDVGKIAVIGVMDSIGDGVGDVGGSATDSNTWGNGGGGFARRAFYKMGLPYCSFSLSGRELSDSVASRTLMEKLATYHTHAISEMITNDIAGGRTLAVCQSAAQTVWASLKANLKAQKYVAQSTCMPRLTAASIDKNATIANQIVAAAFVTGGMRDQFNFWLEQQLGLNVINAIINLDAAVRDPVATDKWAIRPYTSNLSAAVTASATTATVAALPAYGECLVADPAGANVSTGYANVVGFTGTGPYTVTIAQAFGVAQTSGAAVKATPTLDGAHPAPPVHAGPMVDAVVKSFAVN